MLETLSIDNYALIEHTELRLSSGLTVITGETGAGKSILLGALSLLLGGKADAATLLDKTRKCVVEGTFDLRGLDLRGLFERHSMEWDSETIVRREVQPTGKSRAFVNDTPAPVAFLKELGARLIDIHSQHQNLLLAESAWQLWLVDSVAGTDAARSAYSAAYASMRAKREELRSLTAAQERQSREIEYDRAELRELTEANLADPGEQETLEAQARRLDRAEELRERLAQGIAALDSDETGALARLVDTQQALQKVAEFLPADQQLSERVESARIDLDDVCQTLRDLLEGVDLDAESQATIRARLDRLNALTQKYRAGSLRQLMDRREELTRKLGDIDNYDERLATLTGELRELTAAAQALAEDLTGRRVAVFDHIRAHVEGQLRQMGMDNAHLEVTRQAVELCPTGADEIRLLFAANKNGQPRDIAQVASGGEMSRVMLSIKSLLSRSAQLPTIIFDEIDTGVSGEVADRMGAIMSDMARGMQVVAITHLPQVAAQGREHYRVYKRDTAERTVSEMELLQGEARVTEIAGMLSGAQVTQAARDNAQELLNLAQDGGGRGQTATTTQHTEP